MRRMIIAISLVVLSGVLFLSAPVLAGSDIKGAPIRTEIAANSIITPTPVQQTPSTLTSIIKSIKLRFAGWLGISPMLEDIKILPTQGGPEKSDTDLSKPKPELDIQRDHGGDVAV